MGINTNFNIMKAAEAERISNQSHIGFKKEGTILKTITDSAYKGEYYAKLDFQINAKMCNRLRSDGYLVTGLEDSTFIGWGSQFAKEISMQSVAKGDWITGERSDRIRDKNITAEAEKLNG